MWVEQLHISEYCDLYICACVYAINITTASQPGSTGNTLHTRVYPTVVLASGNWKEFNCIPAYVHIYIVRWNVIADNLQIMAL